MANDHVIGTVKSVFFEKPEDFFKIILVEITKTTFEWDDTEIVITGTFAELSDNQEYDFNGEVITHPKYGKQFKCFSYQKNSPTDENSLINYFSGADFPGIGVKTAHKIVDALGNDAIEAIVKNPNALDQINIQTSKKKQIVDKIEESYQSERVILQLNRLGFGNKIAFRIYHKYGEETESKIHENPYQLVQDINGVGFKKADEVARAFKIAADSPLRIAAGIQQTINLAVNSSGDTFVEEEDLINQTLHLLTYSRAEQVIREQIQKSLDELVNNHDIYLEDKRYYPKYLYDDEWIIARQLKLLDDNFDSPNYTHGQVKKALKKVESDLQITYDQNQMEAIFNGLNNSVFLLTGGPGTGKTTIINGLVAVFARLHEYSLDINDYSSEPFPVVLAAPTGRAAKHMSESTGLPASTIHRLLGLSGQEDLDEVETKNLEGQLLIIDETSMVDVELFRLLIEAVPLKMQVILVGDQDQLPSVGPGQVFSDLIKSDAFTATKLTKIYRQKQGSSIIDLAQQINQGKISDDIFANNADRSFIDCSSAQVPSVIKQIVNKSEEHGFKNDDLQVLSPMYRGPAGIDNLNQIMQDDLNPKHNRTKEIKFGNIAYRIHDKVVHLVNNAEDNVFNGEIGIVDGITLSKDNDNEGDLIHLNFYGQEIEYGKSDLKNISLAYCTSIHKAQGSEFNLVILVLVNQQSRMLKRNLLYTAITRAKSKLIMVGDKSAYERAIQDNSGLRNTSLKERIQKTFKITKDESQKELDLNQVQILSADDIKNNTVDPMIGMDDVSPKDFMA